MPIIGTWCHFHFVFVNTAILNSAFSFLCKGWDFFSLFRCSSRLIYFQTVSHFFVSGRNPLTFFVSTTYEHGCRDWCSVAVGLSVFHGLLSLWSWVPSTTAWGLLPLTNFHLSLHSPCIQLIWNSITGPISGKRSDGVNHSAFNASTWLNLYPL